MEEGVRLRYVGLVVFFARVVGAVGGLVFIILVVRRLTPEELGLWQWISRVASYALIPGLIVGFWVLRFSARDWTSARTGLVLGAILSLPALATYLVLIPLLAGAVQAGSYIFLLSAALIPLNYLTLMMIEIASGTRMQDVGYGEMAYESVKLSVAFVLVFMLHLGLTGAILSVEMGLALQFIIQVVLLRKYLRGKFRKDLAKQWISYSWLSAYISQSTILVSFDAAIVVAVAGLQATTVLAYFTVASAVGALVGLSAWLASGLSPKLLKGGQARDIEVILKLTLLFGIPMLFGLLMIAGPMLYLYGSTYSIVITITRILALSAFLDSILVIADTVVGCTVDIDKGKPNFKELVSSRLFRLPSINFVMGLCYLVVLYVSLTYLLPASTISPEQIASLWAASLVFLKLLFGIFKLWYARRVIRFGIPLRAIARYIIAAAMMAVVLALCLPFVAYVPAIQQFIIYPLALIGIGAASYSVVMLLIDREFRQLVRTVLRRK
jgi:O-antigen/teichoic acid export membrane protein